MIKIRNRLQRKGNGLERRTRKLPGGENVLYVLEQCFQGINKYQKPNRTPKSSTLHFFFFLFFFLFFFFFFFWPLQELTEVLDQGLNLHHSSDPSHSSDSIRCLTHCATREFLFKFFFCMLIIPLKRRKKKKREREDLRLIGHSDDKMENTDYYTYPSKLDGI